VKLSDPALFRQACYINGSWLSGSATIEVANPADNTVIGSVPSFGKSQVREAVKSAKKAFGTWSRMTADKRSRILKRWYDLICENKDDLAYIITCEQGKPLSEAVIEVLSAAAYVEWFAEEGKRVYGDTIPMSQEDKRIVVLKEPVGVCAAITPWNFPLSMVTRKSAPALAAGCTMVVKPSEFTPYSALALAELAHRAGLPPGVLNVITGQAKEIGLELTTNDDIRKVSFSGSTEVGKLIMRECSGSLKKISLELGGHAPFIVFEDADIDLAVADAIASKFRNSGQTCVCANRFLVQDGVYEEFVEKFIRAAENQLIIGSGFVTGNNIGPLIDNKAIEKIENQLRDALGNGAKLAVGGKRITGKGFFFEPTVLVDVTPQMRIAREETFGPIAPILRFKTEEEAIRLANDSEYGLSAYFYSRDIARAWRITESLEYGMVGVNTARLSSEAAPFGGMKKSGMGREGSKYGMDEYLEIKYMCIGGIREKSRH
jgi:succinate-semialdehyde dehydrogenase / glutarate-semialdehyde dehydrogenase